MGLFIGQDFIGVIILTPIMPLLLITMCPPSLTGTRGLQHPGTRGQILAHSLNLHRQHHCHRIDDDPDVVHRYHTKSMKHILRETKSFLALKDQLESTSHFSWSGPSMKWMKNSCQGGKDKT